jgi:hypothetical protein
LQCESRVKLAKDKVANGRNGESGGEEAKKTELRETTKEEAGVSRDPGKPVTCAGVMDLLLVSEGKPNVNVREKK